VRRLLPLLLVLLLVGQTSHSWNMTKPPDPIKILYNATGVRKPDAGPVRGLIDQLGNISGTNTTNKTATSCKPPDSWLSWDTFGYIGCKVKEGVKSLASWIKDKIEAVPIIGAVVKFLDLFGAMLLQLIFNIGWLLFNTGAALLAAIASFVEIVVWFFTVVTTYVGNIIPWIPWIVLTMILATFVDSANRAARERSLFPLLGFVTMWLDFFERIYRLFEKLFKLFKMLVEIIIEILKP